jgi:hypothetical protein
MPAAAAVLRGCALGGVTYLSVLPSTCAAMKSAAQSASRLLLLKITNILCLI